jgi:hypothetical protein
LQNIVLNLAAPALNLTSDPREIDHLRDRVRLYLQVMLVVDLVAHVSDQMRDAAIKLIKPELLGVGEQRQQAIQRFEREAQMTANLRSPHTVELYDFGLSDASALYYVMELLEGIDLQALVTRYGTMPPERVVLELQASLRTTEDRTRWDQEEAQRWWNVHKPEREIRVIAPLDAATLTVQRGMG